MTIDAELFGPDAGLHQQMYATIAPRIISGPWHWFNWLFAQGAKRSFVAHLIRLCAECELKIPGLGWSFLDDVASISGREKYEPHYEMLMQKLSEILIVHRLLYLPWPEGAIFAHEPAAVPQGKRPELKVETNDIIYLFEVKAPALLSHQRARGQNPVQFPGRMFDVPMRDLLAMGCEPTLPRDNPIKDFLSSAEEKFAPFQGEKECRGVLVIVWDDHIFEPITSLVHEPSQGLLTPNSFAKVNEVPVQYPHVDSVVIVRHLLYFQQGAAEQLVERRHAFDFGEPGDLPNVLISVPGGKVLPDFIVTGLRALPYDHEAIRDFSDYRPKEFVMWFNV